MSFLHVMYPIQHRDTNGDYISGYYYVILDDCWSNGRTANGTLQPNATKFPNGMPYVADQLHSMGLGFGMYSSAGKYTCAQYAASLGMEKQDAQTFADWGVGTSCCFSMASV